MEFQSWQDVFKNSFQNIWYGIADFLPSLIIALLVVIIGWIVAVLVGKAVIHLIRAVKIDNALRGTEVERIVNRGGFKVDIGALLGGLVKWFIVVVFLIAALDIMDLDQVTQFLQDVVLGYLPSVIVAVIILVAAAIIADVVERIVEGAARAANVRQAGFLGRVVRWSIWVFAILAALFHLGIAAPFVQTLFTGFVIAVSIAFGLAFGLGGQQAASQYLEKLRKDLPQDRER